MRSIPRGRALAALALAAFAVAAAAQDYPSRPVKIIAPNPPGGGFDFVARVAAERLSAQLGQQFIVENRVGSGTVVGTTAAARSAPDGYTLVVGGLSNIALNPGLYKELPYDPLADFTPVGLIATYSYTLVGRKDLPQASLKEIVELRAREPGQGQLRRRRPRYRPADRRGDPCTAHRHDLPFRAVQGRGRRVSGSPRRARRSLLRPHRHRAAVHRRRAGEGHRHLVGAAQPAASGGADDQRERRRRARNGDLVRPFRACEDAAGDPRPPARRDRESRRASQTSSRASRRRPRGSCA